MIFTVDIHHHMLPDFFWRATNEGDHPVGGITPPPWSRASALSFLDEAGIDVGSDYPYLRRDLAVSCRECIEASPELTDGERMAVLGVTATKLIPRLASLLPQTQTRAS